MSLKNLILEGINVFQIYVLIRTDVNCNKVEIYNQIRALEGVIVVTVEKNDFLINRGTNSYEYSLLHIKYISNGKDPVSDIQQIQLNAMSQSKIPGLLQFIPRPKTIIKKAMY